MVGVAQQVFGHNFYRFHDMIYKKLTKTGCNEIRHAFDPHLSGENVTAGTKVLGKFYFGHGEKIFIGNREYALRIITT